MRAGICILEKLQCIRLIYRLCPQCRQSREPIILQATRFSLSASKQKGCCTAAPLHLHTHSHAKRIIQLDPRIPVLPFETRRLMCGLLNSQGSLDLLQRRRVIDGRQITRIAAFRKRLNRTTQHFARAGLGQSGDEVNVLGPSNGT